MSTSESHYEVRDLKFCYRLGTQTVHALRGVSLEIDRGSFTCLTGPSGSGKTTLLNVLGLIEPVQQGDVLLGSESFSRISERERNAIRRTRIGFVFQSFQLFPILNAEENVEYFLARQGLPSRERKERVAEALEAVGLAEHRLKRPLEMSGGQRQRVAVARALAKRPEVILADEPTASLDQQNGAGIMNLFKTLNRERGVTVVVSSHDPMVLSYADRHLKLKDGLL